MRGDELIVALFATEETSLQDHLDMQLPTTSTLSSDIAARGVLLIDGYYLKKATREVNIRTGRKRRRVDFALLEKYLTTRVGVVFAEKFWFDATPEETAPSYSSFLRNIQCLGYRCPTYHLKSITRKMVCDHCRHDCTVSVTSQDRVDAGIVTQILLAAHSPTVTDIVLISGDSDFCEQVEIAKQKGKRVWLLSLPTSLSPELRSLVGPSFISLVEAWPEIQFGEERTAWSTLPLSKHV